MEFRNLFFFHVNAVESFKPFICAHNKREGKQIVLFRVLTNDHKLARFVHYINEILLDFINSLHSANKITL
jgi:hypothetical protein